MAESNGVNGDAAVRTLARLIAAEMLAAPNLRQLVREVTLRTLTEQHVIQKACIARGFLDACSAAGVRVRLGKEGKLHVKGPLPEDLRAALLSAHDEIVQHLRREREVLEMTEQRIQAQDGRQTKADAKLYEEWRRCGGADAPATVPLGKREGT